MSEQPPAAPPERVAPDRAAVVLEGERLARHYSPPAGWAGSAARWVGSGGRGAEERSAASRTEAAAEGRRSPVPDGGVRAVEDVSVTIREGETLALVGESGCGKSTTARLLLGLEPPTSGAVRYRGSDLRRMSPAERLEFRRRVQLVFQDPFGSLNPRLTVGAMLGEVLRFHRLASRERLDSRIAELLELVGLSADAGERYPHEFSGGQRQRIGIARALAVEPELIVADEPVSALDVSIQAQVLNLLADLQNRLRLSYLFIAHDLAVVRQVADRVAVMYAGRIVEEAAAESLYTRPLHPYTRALLAAVPQPRPPERPADGVDANAAGQAAAKAAGQAGGSSAEAATPSVADRADARPDAQPGGCPYYARCSHPARDEACTRHLPALEERAPGRRARCIKA